ncbi:DUF2946 family protein [Gymnodinialimonas ceratoperidinii]|uniref:DUF2946 domain-containing protein n=1 Tax=Gymnodinialimonas ceratoperidinii TaxID=2856823 RepID=A0A8F6YDP5_9RHOB|nr:DUF2946 family protein [Gymnodinialimonas ceratoperidinii]QXT40705.1 hypothetical protein KYE46_05575 [Gymnodinialimonas ceratoperidinii]
MIRRALIPTFIVFALVLTSLAAVVAQTRMAVAGGYCGTGAPILLLDRAGVPILDDAGEAVAAPECPACHLVLAATPPPRAGVQPIRATLRPAQPFTAHPLTALHVFQGGHARAPPRGV